MNSETQTGTAPCDNRVIGHCVVCNDPLTPENIAACEHCDRGPWCPDCADSQHDCPAFPDDPDGCCEPEDALFDDDPDDFGEFGLQW